MIGSSLPTIDRADPYEAVVDTCYEDLLLFANETGALCEGSRRFPASGILNDTDFEAEPANGTSTDVDVDGLNNWWAMLALVLVLGTAAGNILVCLAIARERRLQNVTNYFLMSLAITDLLVAVLVMPLGILTLVRGSSERGVVLTKFELQGVVGGGIDDLWMATRLDVSASG
ncbi:Dopamine D2-like receptor [Melipona quadrifasciata]|uniref:Dopamine D2-like receptor n=1 Tax=Melipona quadrifasciata TaxID=166423 RepID=A0A0N0U6L6_9HYME|nr:Dopamine D2-like receptor [Melipona quadrifasciata]